MALSYEFSIGSVRAKETSLLGKTDIEQLLGCKTMQELCQTLSNKGWGSGKDFDAVAEDHMNGVWAYLKSIAPDFEVFTPFIIPNDAHNFKVTLKGTMSARDYYTSLLVTPCTVEHGVIKNAVEHRNMGGLPEWLRGAAGQAYDLLAQTGDARSCDAVLDRAVMEETLRFVEDLKSEFLKEYFHTQIFYNNIKTAIRSTRTGADKHYLKRALCDLEGFDRERITAAALKGSDALLDTLGKLGEYGCRQAAKAYQESPSAFEKFVDNRLIALAKESCRRVSEGPEPMLGYYLGAEAEKKVINIIASGVRTRAGADITRERLREIYG